MANASTAFSDPSVKACISVSYWKISDLIVLKIFLCQCYELSCIITQHCDHQV